MSAARGQVVWTAEPSPLSLAQRCGLSNVSYTPAGEPVDLDSDGGEKVVSRFEQVAAVLGDSQQQEAGWLCITNRYGAPSGPLCSEVARTLLAVGDKGVLDLLAEWVTLCLQSVCRNKEYLRLCHASLDR